MESQQHSSPHRLRVNGSILAQNLNKEVCVLGTVVRADGGGTSFQMKASDGVQLNVRLKSPISEPLTGLVEVYGICQGNNFIVADSITGFPESISNSFDMGVYNEAVKLINTVEDNNNWLRS